MKKFPFVVLAVLAMATVRAQPGSFRDEVTGLISLWDIRSVEQFLDIFKTHRPRLFEHYVFMFRSGSRQVADPQRPRAIVFDPEEGVVVAFNGDRTQRGGNKVEFMEFDRRAQRFSFFEADFGRPPAEVVSEANPRECQRCHRSDARPNWDSYSFWSGVFGGDDDGYTSDISYLLDRYGEGFVEEANASERERFRDLFGSNEGRRYIRFYLSRGAHPRYSLLPDYELSEDHNSSYPEVRPALQLTRLLGELNRKRIERKIEEAVLAEPRFKYAILGAAYCLSNGSYFDSITDIRGDIVREDYEEAAYSLEDFIPPHLIAIWQEPKAYLQDQIDVVKGDLMRRIRVHEAASGDDITEMGRLDNAFDEQGEFVSLASRTDFLVAPTLAPLLYVLELAGLGEEEDDWSMNHSGAPIMHRSSYVVGKSFVLGVLEGDATLPRPVVGSLCGALASRSMEVLSSFLEIPKLPEILEVPPPEIPEPPVLRWWDFVSP